ncbi:hypothetical protein SESBI_19105 [Sesbania bispinosa]|nr:hypothetical protein SESBI_19105 [Sesbania bispinosa]
MALAVERDDDALMAGARWRGWDRSVRFIGEESLKYMKKANWNLNRATGGGDGTTEQCKLFGFLINR